MGGLSNETIGPIVVDVDEHRRPCKSGDTFTYRGNVCVFRCRRNQFTTGRRRSPSIIVVVAVRVFRSLVILCSTLIIISHSVISIVSSSQTPTAKDRTCDETKLPFPRENQALNESLLAVYARFHVVKSNSRQISKCGIFL